MKTKTRLPYLLFFLLTFTISPVFSQEAVLNLPHTSDPTCFSNYVLKSIYYAQVTSLFRVFYYSPFLIDAIIDTSCHRAPLKFY